MPGRGQPNAERRLPPLVFVQTWGVEGDYLEALAAAVGPAQPILAIEPPSKEVCAGLERVGDWVRYELEHLSEVPAEPPYRLAGWSFGGVVALELARRLSEDGIAVASVDLVDTWLPRSHPRTPTESLLQHLLRLNALEPVQRREYVSGVVRRLPHEARKLGQAQARRVRDRVRKRPPPERKAVDPRLRAIWVPFVKYEPRPYLDHVTIHASEHSVARNNGDPSLGWSRWLVGGFEALRVPGKHRTMWEPPHVDVLAAGLTRQARHS